MLALPSCDFVGVTFYLSIAVTDCSLLAESSSQAARCKGDLVCLKQLQTVLDTVLTAQKFRESILCSAQWAINRVKQPSQSTTFQTIRPQIKLWNPHSCSQPTSMSALQWILQSFNDVRSRPAAAAEFAPGLLLFISSVVGMVAVNPRASCNAACAVLACGSSAVVSGAVQQKATVSPKPACQPHVCRLWPVWMGFASNRPLSSWEHI